MNRKPIIPGPKPTDPRFIDLTNKQFNLLTVVGYAGYILKTSGDRTRPIYYWQVKCSCGKEYITTGKAIKNSESCGHLRNPKIAKLRTKHGRSENDRTYTSYCGMMDRCHNPNAESRKYYADRGITVYKRWRGNFEAFLSDMGERPAGKSLDRIDNDKGYSPDNCRWATQTEQTRNTRQNVMLTIDGKTNCLHDWLKILGVSKATYYSRVRKGWAPIKALTTPANAKH